MDSRIGEVIEDLKAHLEYLKTMWIDSIPATAAPSKKQSPSSSLLTLRDVREELGDCKRCKLHRGRKTLVFGEGNEKAVLMFVGEGPGYEEDVQGRPFVGKAGQLLTKIIQSIQLEREEVYIANIVKCRPPQNRTPEADEVLACRPFRAVAPGLLANLFTGISDQCLDHKPDTGLFQNVLTRLNCLVSHLVPVILNLV